VYPTRVRTRYRLSQGAPRVRNSLSLSWGGVTRAAPGRKKPNSYGTPVKVPGMAPPTQPDTILHINAAGLDTSFQIRCYDSSVVSAKYLAFVTE